MPKTTYLENAVLNSVLCGIPYISPEISYVALFTTVPLPNGTGTEVLGGSYVRQAVLFEPATEGAVYNQADVVFPRATTSWGTVVALAFFDALFSGNMLYYVTFPSSYIIQLGDQIKFVAGTLAVAEH